MPAEPTAQPGALLSVAPSPARIRASAALELVRRLFATRFGGIGVVILLTVTMLSILAPVFASVGPTNIGSPSLQPPSWQHPLGTDSLGRDVWSVLLYAGRSS